MQLLPFTKRHLSELEEHHQKVTCNHAMFTELLVQQWKKLTPREIEKTNYIKRNIALLIECKYGINPILTEDYLTNIDRALPKAA